MKQINFRNPRVWGTGLALLVIIALIVLFTVFANREKEVTDTGVNTVETTMCEEPAIETVTNTVYVDKVEEVEKIVEVEVEKEVPVEVMCQRDTRETEDRVDRSTRETRENINTREARDSRGTRETRETR